MEVLETLEFFSLTDQHRSFLSALATKEKAQALH